ncbi:MAG: DUF4126 domain-containing protein [Nitriliruptor sp.]|nr:MAG: DUF4126 domain-containing protein [Nitriliruptor sp.]
MASSGWASGVNLYLVAALVGGAGRLQWIEAPAALMRTDVLIVATSLFLLEFFADKIPYLDSAWDVAHTFIRPVGAAIIGVLLTGDAEAFDQAIGGLTAGGMATASHLVKATTRAAINTSPEPFSNIGTSLFEDGLVLGVVWLMFTNPLLALAIVIVLLVAGTVLAFAVFRLARRGMARMRERREARRGTPTPPPASQP